MKKLLALLFIGCMSVSLVGMDQKPTMQDDEEENQKDDVRSGNQPLSMFEGDDDPEDIKKRYEDDNNHNGFERIAYRPGYTTLKVNNPQFYHITPEEKKGYGQRLRERTEHYVIDGIAHELARPIVEIASIPIHFVINFISSTVFKSQIEQSDLQDVRNGYAKSLSTTADTLFGNINKQNVLNGQLKAMIEENGLDPAELKRAEQDMQDLMLEFQTELVSDFQERGQAGTLSQEEKTIWNMFSIKQQQVKQSNDREKLYELSAWLQEKLVLNFNKRLQNNSASQKEKELKKKLDDKQQELIERAKSFKEDDFTLIATYNQYRKAQRDNIYEALQLTEAHNSMLKENFSHAQANAVAQEKDLVQKIQQRQLKEQQAHAARENRRKARELKEQEETREH